VRDGWPGTATGRVVRCEEPKLGRLCSLSEPFRPQKPMPSPCPGVSVPRPLGTYSWRVHSTLIVRCRCRTEPKPSSRRFRGTARQLVGFAVTADDRRRPHPVETAASVIVQNSPAHRAVRNVFPGQQGIKRPGAPVLSTPPPSTLSLVPIARSRPLATFFGSPKGRSPSRLEPIECRLADLGCADAPACEFYGIAIYMYFIDHSPPHFHAIYGEHEALVRIDDGQVLHGALPRTASRLVEQWRSDNVPELERNWAGAGPRTGRSELDRAPPVG